METHLPYLPPIRYQKFGEKHYPLFEKTYTNWRERRYKQWAGIKAFSETDFKKLNDLYDNALFYMDSQIGNYIKTLKKQNLYDDTLIIITADHGENIGDHNLIDHMFSLHDTLLKIPLIIKHPDIFPQRRKELVENKNIFHAILNLVEKKADKFFPQSEYIFGESENLEQQVKKIKKYGANKFTKGQYLRTNKYKLVKYDDTKKALYAVNEKEQLIDKPEAMKYFSHLIQIKEKKLREISSIRNTINYIARNNI